MYDYTIIGAGYGGLSAQRCFHKKAKKFF